MTSKIKAQSALCKMHSSKIIAYGFCLAFVVQSTIAEVDNDKHKLDTALAAIADSPIRCTVHADDETIQASLACTFPVDIAAFQMGFDVYVDSKRGHKDFTDVISSCYWDLAAVLRCLGKDTGAATGTYDKVTRTATVPIPRSAARAYLLSCELSQHSSVRSSPCHMHIDGSISEKSSWRQSIIISLLVALIITFIICLALFALLCRGRFCKWTLKASDTHLSDEGQEPLSQNGENTESVSDTTEQATLCQSSIKALTDTVRYRLSWSSFASDTNNSGTKTVEIVDQNCS